MISQKYSKGYITRVFNSVPPHKLRKMKSCIKIGYTVDQLVKEFRVLESVAHIVYDRYVIPEKGVIENRLGYKNESYYEKESDMIIPDYKLEDLTGEEKYIAKNLSKFKKKWEK